jgi:hypothetical protein
MRRNWLRALYIPIDGGLRIRRQPLFGASKTWRGVAVAITGCIVGAAIQRYLLVSPMKAMSLMDYSRLNVFAFGAAMGAGAMLGELPNSFVKRRLGIGSGMATTRRSAPLFYIWDQIGLLSLAWPMIAFWVAPTFAIVATSITISLVLHPLSSHLGFVIAARTTAR